MTIVFSRLARSRQTFFVASVASRAVSVRFYSGMVRSLGATFAASTITMDEASMQVFGVVMSRASLSHLNETIRSS
jgi:hypothetical protein